MRGGPREDGAVGADDRLNAGHPVYCPGERGALFEGAQVMLLMRRWNDGLKKRSTWLSL